jgi:AcrR family transcriptional regulator
MTRHRRPEEWIAEILDAAAAEIEERGYPALTMEAVAKRTELSKGGVYRFFANKHELALALFTRCYRQSLDIDVDAAVAWDLPITETFFRVILRFNLTEEQAQRADKIWLHLIPEVLRDDRFGRERARLLEKIMAKFRELAVRLATRDGVVVTDQARDRIGRSIELGVALFEGFAIQGSLGGAVAEQAAMARLFIEALVGSVLAPDGEEGIVAAARPAGAIGEEARSS